MYVLRPGLVKGDTRGQGALTTVRSYIASLAVGTVVGLVANESYEASESGPG